ncbi:MAG: DNA polymerase I [Planctomycetaceae bacterium]|jgi:DNA polymerase-1|nr:DNA polymerase I [Planctomycetaceae bacterium]
MSVYILDAHGILYQNFYGLPPMSSPFGEPVGAVFGFARDLFTLVNEHCPDALLCAFDMHGETFRHKLYPQYKANRKSMPDDLRPQIDFARKLLDAFGVPSVGIDGFEADDCIATISRLAEEQNNDCVIVTADKDCRQLISQHVTLYNLRKQQRYSFDQLQADWGIAPSQVTDFQAIVGDSTDNVPGIPFIGPKMATQLLNQFGTLENILENVDKISGAKRKENIAASRDAVFLSRRLVTLDRHAPLTIDWDAVRFKGVNAAEVTTLFKKFGFRSLIDKVKDLPFIPGTEYSPNSESENQVNNPRTAPRTISHHASIQQSSAPSLFDDIDDESSAPSTQPDQPTSQVSTTIYHLIDTSAEFDIFLSKLNSHVAANPIFAFDTETMPMSNAFEATMPRYTHIVGLSFCWNDDEAFYIPLRAPQGSQTLDEQTVLTALKPILENPSIGKIGQNLKYDIIVMNTAGIHIRGLVFDTMIADYLLHTGEGEHNLDNLASVYLNYQKIPTKQLIDSGAKQRTMNEVPTQLITEYAGEDVWTVWRLYPILKQLLENERYGTNGETDTAKSGSLSGIKSLADLNAKLELPLVEVLADIEATGIAIDKNKLKKISSDFESQLHTLEERVYELAGHKFNLASPLQLRKVLFDELKLPIIKRSPTKSPSTDSDVLNELAQQHELPEKVSEHRTISKLKGTYTDTLPLLINPDTGRIHASFNQVVTSTGRLSSSNPNLQNIPVRTEQGQLIRESFVPGDGMDTILSCDYSQIELRVLAHYCGDTNLCSAFANDMDIHTSVAAEVFGVPIDEVTSAMRYQAKAVNFGVIYGQSPFGLAKSIKISKEEAAAFIDAYFAKYPGIETFIERTLSMCNQYGFVETLLGHRRMIKGVRVGRRRELNQPERYAINTVIQGSAADLMKLAMVNVHKKLLSERANGLRANMLLQIHDELVFETVETQTEQLEQLVIKEMVLGNPLCVPLKIDCEYAKCWK